MKIVMTLLVRNEEDIIEDNIEFHLKLGIDFFIITNHKSTDKTPEILSKYQNKNIVEVINEYSDTYSQSNWVTKMARLAYDKYNADWVINSDADEFWFPTCGNFHDYFSNINEDINKIHINRYDFLYKPYGNIKYYDALLFREANRKWTKCIHRGLPNIIVEIGNHNANTENCELSYKIEDSNVFKIYHYPIRDICKYIDKILTGSQALLNTTNRPYDAGFHWINLYSRINNKSKDEMEKITLEYLYDQNKAVYHFEHINKLIKEDIIKYDDCIQRIFHTIKGIKDG